MNTHRIKKIIVKNSVITLKADKTHRNRAGDVNDLLVELGNYGKTIPYLAIYPAGESAPIILDGLITQDQLAKALERAGPSRNAGDEGEELSQRSPRELSRGV